MNKQNIINKGDIFSYTNRNIDDETVNRILFEFNDTLSDYPKDKTISQLFEEQVEKTPKAIALVQGNEHIDYRELDNQANKIANYIFKQCHEDSNKEKIIAILYEQSINMIVSMIGVLKAGFAFLTIDPTLPEQSQMHMLNEAKCPIIISSKKYIGLLNRLQWECKSVKTYLCLDTEEVYEEKERKLNPLMDKKLWNYVGEKSDTSAGRGGWKSSFTGELFTQEELKECADNVLIKLKPYINNQTKVLEIGCSSGITMFNMASQVKLYYGTDLSDIIIEETKNQALNEGYLNIKLETLPAHDIDKVEVKEFDIIILNSVVQAFNGHNYLRQVIRRAIGLLKNKGIIFIGDIMDQDLKEEMIMCLKDFEAGHQGLGYTTKTDFSNELFLSPDFFSDLILEQKEIVNCEISKKVYTIKNELTEYRYDAMMFINKDNHKNKECKKVKYQHDLGELSKYSEKRLNKLVKNSNLAYVIFTSGSTGKPKGVMVEHRALVNMVWWYKKYHRVTVMDRSTKFANCGFDASLLEIFPIIISGASIYILDNETKGDLNILNRYLEDNKITICFLPTQYCEEFMTLKNKSLRILNTGGEKLKRYIKNDYAVVNNYGPTECTVVSTIFVVDKPYKNIPVGRPIANTRVYILDENMQILPEGEIGELYIAGDGLARGYLNMPELTKEKYIEDPFYKDQKMYRTGDLARWCLDGNIEFYGRIDNQVKIRGYRIELEEIEARILEYPAIQKCVVTVYKDRSGDKSICAYITSSELIENTALTKYLSKQIPKYMLPKYFYFLDDMPLTQNGKINKKALPAPDDTTINRNDYKKPSSETEKVLGEIWQSILGVDSIGIYDDFFSLGGHSLKVLKAALEINKKFEVELSAAELFKAPTIYEQSKLINASKIIKYIPIPVCGNKDYYPITPSQKRLYVIQQMDTNNTAYNIPFLFSIKGDLNKEKLTEAFYKVLMKQQILRTDFHMKDHKIVQKVRKEIDINIEYEKLTDVNVEYKKLTYVNIEYKKLTGVDIEDININEVIKNFVRPFRLNSAPLFRIKLIEMGIKDYLLILDIHHIVIDGSSAEILFEEISKAHNGEKLETLKVQYSDFAEWRVDENVQHSLERQKEYWLKEFKEVPPVLNLPLDYPRPKYQSFEGDTYSFNIDSKITEKLEYICKDFGISMNMLLLAVYKILLSKYSGQEDIVVGSPIYGRSHSDLKNVIGMFANTLALRSNPSGNKSFSDYLLEIKEMMLKALNNQDYPFEELVENLDLYRDISRNPLFDTMFVTQKFTSDNLVLKDLEIKSLNVETKKSKFDMTWYATIKNGIINIDIEYAIMLFRRDKIVNASKHYIKIISQIIENPLMPISDIEIINDEEKQRILEEFCYTKKYDNENKLVYKLFEEVVENNKEKTALVFDNKTMSYEELNKRANQTASFLRKNDAMTGMVIALIANRSFEMIIGLLAIIKAGAACLPINPNYPPSYINEILADSRVKIILKNTDEDSSHINLDNNKFTIVDIHNPLIKSEDCSNLICESSPRSMLYIIYTSGTSGKPKGVVIQNRNFVNLMNWQQSDTDIDFSSVLQFASITFDVSFQEIFSCLLSGGKLLLVSEDDKLDVLGLFSKLEKEEIRTVFFPPALLQLLFSEKEYINSFPRSVKYIISAGEQLFISDSFKKFIIENEIFLFNHYGPSETHVVTALMIDPNDLVPNKPSIGKPIGNINIYIVGKHNELMPTGVVGELCIAGESIGGGYLNNAELTKIKFIQDPFKEGQQLYYSGDLAKWNQDGSIEFLCRIDKQIKIRGYRIEPAAIEKLLNCYEGIKTSLVIPVEENNQFLCAYVICETNILSKDLKNYLQKYLPRYMVPDYFVCMRVFPLNMNGKVNIKELPSPVNIKRDCAKEYVTEENLTIKQKKLSEIWQKVLCIDNVSLYDNFFSLGGNSLKILQLVLEIKKEFNVEVSAADLFKAQTIDEHCKLVSTSEKESFDPIIPVELCEYYNISSAQKRIYIAQMLDNENTAYNMPFVFNIKGQLDIERLKEAFRKVINKHEILRTEFHVIKAQIVQKVIDITDLSMDYLESGYLEQAEQDKMISDFIRPFNLNSAPLLRIKVIQIKEAEYLLLIDIHHIILDGTSMEILWGEVSKAYNGEELEKLCVQYKDYAHWQLSEENMNKNQKQRKYLFKQLAGDIPVLNLPLDYKRPEYKSYKGEILNFTIETQITKKLKYLSTKYDVSINMLLLAIYKVLLSKYSGQWDIIIGMPTYGRNHPNLEHSLGMFVNTLAIRSFPKGEKRFCDYLLEIKDIMVNALDNQDYPFEKLVEELNINRNPGRNPIFDTMFVTQKFKIDNLKLENLKITNLRPKLKNSKFDMTFFASVEEDSIEFDIEYSTDLFRGETIVNIFECYKKIIEIIINNPIINISDIAPNITSNITMEEKYRGANGFICSDISKNQKVGNLCKTSIEEKMTEIWQEVLELDYIDVNDDFFDLGGQSLRAILLMVKIKKVFKKELPGSAIFKYSTIRKLSNLIEEARAITFTHLVKIRESSDENRIFCIHPAPGTVICYKELAKYLDENWSIYALQAKGLERGQVPHETIEDMAKDYIKEIKLIQPHGQYVILGWSVGGRIAYEIAQQLSSQGEKIKLLALLDTDPNFIARVNEKPRALPLFIYGAFSMFTHGRIIYKNLNITSYGLINLFRRLKMWVSLIKSIKRYRPVVYSAGGKVVLFQTKEGCKIEENLKDRSRSIKNFIDKLEVVQIKGKHFEMFSEPNIIEIVNMLNKYLGE